METTWCLKELYESFESEEFLNDLKAVDDLIQRYDLYAQNLSDTDGNKTKKLEEYIQLQQKLSTLFQKLFSFCSLTLSTNTSADS